MHPIEPVQQIHFFGFGFLLGSSGLGNGFITGFVRLAAANFSRSAARFWRRASSSASRSAASLAWLRLGPWLWLRHRLWPWLRLPPWLWLRLRPWLWHRPRLWPWRFGFRRQLRPWPWLRLRVLPVQLQVWFRLGLGGGSAAAAGLAAGFAAALGGCLGGGFLGRCGFFLFFDGQIRFRGQGGQVHGSTPSSVLAMGAMSAALPPSMAGR
jgi:hypothetical protein